MTALVRSMPVPPMTRRDSGRGLGDCSRGGDRRRVSG